MRQHRFLLIFFVCAVFLLSSCGGNVQQRNNVTASTTSDIALLETGKGLSAVRANNGTSLWSITAEGISTPFAVAARRVFYSSSAVTAVDLTSGKQLWSTPINAQATDLQASSTFVYVLANHLLSAFDARNGTLKWHLDNVGLDGSGSGSSVLVDGADGGDFIINGNIIYTAVSGTLTALDATTGAQLWQFTPAALKDISPGVEGLILSGDGKMIVVSYLVSMGAAQDSDALYAVHTDSHMEAWHLDPTSTSTDVLGNVQINHDMALSWFTVTPDNHVLLSESGSESGSTASLPDGYHYLSLSDGSEAWSISLTGQKRSANAGNDRPLIVGDSAFYSLGGPSNGDVSATTLSNHQQAWDNPGSGSYDGLFLSNDILLAWNGLSGTGGGSGGDTLTAFNTQSGKQLWQQQIKTIRDIFPMGQHIFIQSIGQTYADSAIAALDSHSGRQLWSVPNGSLMGSDSLRNVVEFQR